MRINKEVNMPRTLQVSAAAEEAKVAAEAAVYQQLADQEAKHEASLEAVREAGQRHAERAVEAARREEQEQHGKAISSLNAQHQQEVDTITQIVDFSEYALSY